MRRLAQASLAVAVALAAPAAVPAQDGFMPVDTALVLVVDASGSIVGPEFRLQKEGIAQSITDEEVMSAIMAGEYQRIAIAYVEWGSPGLARTVVDWSIVEDEASAEAFAARVLDAKRSPQTYNAIGDGIDHAAELLGQCPCQPARRVIDVSGDNPDNRSVRPSTVAREAAVADGITINALAILENDPIGPSGRPELVEIYEAEVIGGPGAFVMPAESRADFARALRQKMVLEIAGIGNWSPFVTVRADLPGQGARGPAHEIVQP